MTVLQICHRLGVLRSRHARSQRHRPTCRSQVACSWIHILTWRTKAEAAQHLQSNYKKRTRVGVISCRWSGLHGYQSFLWYHKSSSSRRLGHDHLNIRQRIKWQAQDLVDGSNNWFSLLVFNALHPLQIGVTIWMTECKVDECMAFLLKDVDA